jgi:hypothetical protein
VLKRTTGLNVALVSPDTKENTARKNVNLGLLERNVTRNVVVTQPRALSVKFNQDTALVHRDTQGYVARRSVRRVHMVLHAVEPVIASREMLTVIMFLESVTVSLGSTDQIARTLVLKDGPVLTVNCHASVTTVVLVISELGNADVLRASEENSARKVVLQVPTAEIASKSASVQTEATVMQRQASVGVTPDLSEIPVKSHVPPECTEQIVRRTSAPQLLSQCKVSPSVRQDSSVLVVRLNVQKVSTVMVAPRGATV